MASFNYERFLEDAAGSGGNSDLALTVFSGSAIQAFQNATVLWDAQGTFIDIVDITGQATAAQWIIMGDDPVPSNHTPGTEINKQASEGTNVKRLKQTEKEISIDDMLVNALDVPFVDRNTAHYLKKFAQLGMMLGSGMGKVLDRRCFILGLKGARTAALSGVHQGGTVVYRDDGSSTTSGAASVTLAYPLSPTGAYNFRTDLATLAQSFSEKSIPGPWVAWIPPAITSVLRFEPISGSTMQMPSIFETAAASAATRYVRELEGFHLFETNHLPSINMNGSSGTAELDAAASVSKYQGNFSGTYNATTATAKAQARPLLLAFGGISAGKFPIGAVTAGGQRPYITDDERHNTTFVKVQRHLGLDVLHSFCAGSIEIYRDG